MATPSSTLVRLAPSDLAGTSVHNWWPDRCTELLQMTQLVKDGQHLRHLLVLEATEEDPPVRPALARGWHTLPLARLGSAGADDRHQLVALGDHVGDLNLMLAEGHALHHRSETFRVLRGTEALELV